jgi:hypothetical protein
MSDGTFEMAQNGISKIEDMVRVKKRKVLLDIFMNLLSLLLIIEVFTALSSSIQ